MLKTLSSFFVTQAAINVGGHMLSPTTIEHFILRLPYHWKFVSPVHFQSNFTMDENKELTTKLLTATFQTDLLKGSQKS